MQVTASQDENALEHPDRPDYKNALTWFERAAEQEHPLAMYILGQLVMDGRGTKKDLVRGKNLVFSAARLGHAGAQEFAAELQLEELA